MSQKIKAAIIGGIWGIAIGAPVSALLWFVVLPMVFKS